MGYCAIIEPIKASVAYHSHCKHFYLSMKRYNKKQTMRVNWNMMLLIKSEFIPCSRAYSSYVTTALKQLKDNLAVVGQYFPTYSQIKFTQINTNHKSASKGHSAPCFIHGDIA